MTVSELPEGRRLVAAHHPVEPAERPGHRTIGADVHRGTRADALDFAVQLASQQRGISPQVAIDAIKGQERQARSGEPLGGRGGGWV